MELIIFNAHGNKIRKLKRQFQMVYPFPALPGNNHSVHRSFRPGYPGAGPPTVHRLERGTIRLYQHCLYDCLCHLFPRHGNHCGPDRYKKGLHGIDWYLEPCHSVPCTCCQLDRICHCQVLTGRWPIGQFPLSHQGGG